MKIITAMVLAASVIAPTVLAAKRLSSYAATSPARRWPTNGCNATPLGKSC